MPGDDEDSRSRKGLHLRRIFETRQALISLGVIYLGFWFVWLWHCNRCGIEMWRRLERSADTVRRNPAGCRTKIQSRSPKSSNSIIAVKTSSGSSNAPGGPSERLIIFDESSSVRCSISSFSSNSLSQRICEFCRRSDVWAEPKRGRSTCFVRCEKDPF